MSDPTPTAPAPPPGAMTPHLSPLRMLVAGVLIVGAVVGGSRVVRTVVADQPSAGDAWFAPYVDVTATPHFDFQDPEASPAANVVLSFIVADRDEACTPAWGATETIDEAATSLDLDRRIALLRERGGDVVVSFGGAANQELADACTDPQDLADAYRSVISRYRLTTIDLDIEGAALGDEEAVARRAKAIATVQDEQDQAGKALGVWLTLPMTSAGLQPEGVAAIDAMLEAHVELAGVNVMAMEFGSSRPAGMSFADASLAGIDATADQLVAAYQRTGKTVTKAEAYHHVGVTPMIGQNIYPTDRLDTDGAKDLHAGALDRGVRRFSMWSLNRDRQCAGNIDSSVVNDICSGVPQTTMQFSRIFGEGTSPLDQDQHVRFTTSNQVRNRQDGPAPDDSEGPYDVWRPHREYEAGSKVVWHGRVFAAKWWTVGDPPDALVEHDWDSPWSLIGPVLPTDPGPTVPPTIPPNTYPAWSSEVAYDSGAKVERSGVGYLAKWASRGEDPAADVDNPWQTPWQVITPEEAAADRADAVPSDG